MPKQCKENRNKIYLSNRCFATILQNNFNNTTCAKVDVQKLKTLVLTEVLIMTYLFICKCVKTAKNPMCRGDKPQRTIGSPFTFVSNENDTLINENMLPYPHCRV